MDITLNIKITGLECLADGMMALANAWDAANRAIDPSLKRVTKMTVSETAADPGAPAQQTAQQAFASAQQTTSPAQQPVQQTFAPVQPAAADPVQTAAPTYTLDELCMAAAPLMDAGRQQELMDLVARFGIVSLPELPPERFGEFATALRAMGAQI